MFFQQRHYFQFYTAKSYFVRETETEESRFKLTEYLINMKTDMNNRDTNYKLNRTASFTGYLFLSGFVN